MDQNENKQLEEVIVKKRKFPFWLIPIIAAVVIAVVAGTVTLAKNASTSRKYEEYMELARKYASELNYEQAVIAYKAAIDIDPKNPDPYIELANVFCAAGEPEKAREILKTALNTVDDNDKKEVRQELRAVEETLGIVNTADDSGDADDTGIFNSPDSRSDNDREDPGITGDGRDGQDSNASNADTSDDGFWGDDFSDDDSSDEPYIPLGTAEGYSYSTEVNINENESTYDVNTVTSSSNVSPIVPWSEYIANGGQDYDINFNDEVLRAMLPLHYSWSHTTFRTIYYESSLRLHTTDIDPSLAVYDERTRRYSITIDLKELNQVANLDTLRMGPFHMRSSGPSGIDIHLKNIGSLSNLKRFREIEIIGTGTGNSATKIYFDDTDGILGNLKSFRVINCLIDDHSFLSSFPSLEVLNLIRTGFDDLSTLDGLNNLKKLLLSGNRVSDISHLNRHNTIEYLTLSGNPVKDYSPMYGLTKLKYIALDSEAKAEFSKLKTISTLEGISINGNVNDFQWLKDFPRLRALSIDGSSYDAFSGLLGTFNSLYELTIYNCKINDLSAIGRLTTLRRLTLESCSINDITPLGRLRRLEYLWLYNNNVKDVSAIGSLIKLRELWLEQNRIEDISSFGTLENLECLYLGGNNIKSVSSLLGLEKLSYVNLDTSAVLDYMDVLKLKNRGTFSYSTLAEPGYVDIVFETDEKIKRIEGLDLDENNHIRITSDTELKFSVVIEDGYSMSDVRTETVTFGGHSADTYQDGNTNEWILSYDFYDNNYSLIKVNISAY